MKTRRMKFKREELTGYEMQTILELSKMRWGRPSNFISRVHISTKIVGLEG